MVSIKKIKYLSTLKLKKIKFIFGPQKHMFRKLQITSIGIHWPIKFLNQHFVFREPVV